METYKKDFHYEKFEKHRKHFRLKSLIFGVLVIIFGVLLLMKSTGMMTAEVRDIMFSWQMLLIAIGVLNLFGRSWWFGLLLLLTGGFFLVAEMTNSVWNFREAFWPVVIILAGIMFISSSFSKFWKNRVRISSGSEDQLDEVSVFGGSERIIHSQSFKGGKITAVFGGSKFDLTGCRLAEGIQEIDMALVFGGTQLIVPTDWNIKMEVFNIFGGFADKRVNLKVDTSKTLIIKGVAIFGGGELKGY